VSHRAKKEAMGVAKLRDIPIFMYHSCGVCTLRECFNCEKIWSLRCINNDGKNRSNNVGN
jgi:hypothetical protein